MCEKITTEIRNAPIIARLILDCGRATLDFCRAARPKVVNQPQVNQSLPTWFYWALLSAVFAALTAIFAKIGIQGVDSDQATLIRTAIIVVVLFLFVWFAGKWSNPLAWSSKTWLFLGINCAGDRRVVDLLFSRTGRSAKCQKLRRWIN